MLRSINSKNQPANPDTACPDSETISAFVDGNLRGLAHKKMVSHMDTCERCFEVIATAMEMNASLKPAAAQVRPFTRGRRVLATSGILSAAALLLILTPMLIFDDGKTILKAKELSRTAMLQMSQKGKKTWEYRLDANLLEPDIINSFKTFRGATSGSDTSALVKKALDQWQLVLNESPENTEALETIVALALLDQAFDTAILNSERLNLLLNSPKSQSYVHLAKFLVDPHPESASLKDMRQLYQTHSQNPYVVYNFGRMLNKLRNNRVEKCQVWNQYLTLDKNSKYAEEAKDFVALCS